jgi:hypothetical protein
VGRREVRDEDDGKPGFGRQMLQKSLECLEPSGRSAYTHDRKRNGTDVLRRFKGAGIVFGVHTLSLARVPSTRHV